MSTPAPTQGVDILLGTCHFLNAFFVIQLSVAVVVLLLAIASAIMKTKRPTPAKVDYGAPWTLLNLMWSVSFWGIAPIVSFFVLYHQAIPNSFEMASNMACINQGSFPAIPVLFGLAGFVFWVAYRPKASCDQGAELIADELAEAARRKQAQGTNQGGLQVAFLGSSLRGMHYVRSVDLFLKKMAATNGASPRLTLVDLGNQIKFCRASADGIDAEGGNGVRDAMKFADIGPERPVSVNHSSRSLALLNGEDEHVAPFQLPFPSDSLDFVVVPPFFRKMPLFGGMTGGSPGTVRNRSRGIMVEVYRVLKPGGQVLVHDTLDSTLFTLGDCREAGLELLPSSTDTASGETEGAAAVTMENNADDYRSQTRPHQAVIKASYFHRPWVFLRAKMFYGKAEKRQMEGSKDAIAKGHNEIRSLLLATEPELQGVEELPWKTKMTLVCCYQFVVFCLLAVLAGALYKPLDYPTDIVLGQRLGNLIAQLCTNYPMMAYFAREIFLTEGHCYSFGQLLCATVKSDLLSILASLTLSVVFFFPSFGMQIALNDTTLTAGTKSLIGLAIAMALGFGSTYVHTKKKSKKEYLTNDVDPEAAKQLGQR